MGATAGNQGAEFHPVARHGHTVGPFALTWKDEAGTPINLTGAVFEAPIFDDSVQVDSFDVTVTNVLSGGFSFVLPFERSAALLANKLLSYHLSATIGAQKIPLLAGTFTLKSE